MFPAAFDVEKQHLSNQIQKYGLHTSPEMYFITKKQPITNNFTNSYVNLAKEKEKGMYVMHGNSPNMYHIIISHSLKTVYK